MNCTLSTVTTIYAVRVGTLDLGEFRLAGEWEGFRKLYSEKYGVLIVTGDRTGFSAAFGEVFDGLFGGGSPTTFQIVKASPDVWSLLRDAGAIAAKAAEA